MGKTINRGAKKKAEQYDWLRHSYAVQSDLLEAHPQQESLTEIGKLVAEEVVQILGVFTRERHLREFQRRAEEEPGILAQEIGSYVGDTVTRIIAADPAWPRGASGFPYHRREIVVLTPAEIKSLVRCAWYMQAAAFAQWREERGTRPGWEFGWLYSRITKLGVLVQAPVGQRGGPGGGALPAPELEYVVVRSDGSALVKFSGKPIVEHAAVDSSKHLPELTTRRGRRSPNAGEWRSEVTHAFIDGKFVRIEATEID
jgi:hypothetical protein